MMSKNKVAKTPSEYDSRLLYTPVYVRKNLHSTLTHNHSQYSSLTVSFQNIFNILSQPSSRIMSIKKMTKPEIWLPPLNSHPEYSISVVASQQEESWYTSAISDPNFLIHVSVSATCYPDRSDTDITIKGLSNEQSFIRDCCEMDSEQSSREAVSELLQMLNIPFELNKVEWRERGLDGYVKLSGPVQNTDCLLEKIAKLANCAREKAYNAGHNVLPLKLSISKMITVPDFEIRAWNSWFEEEIKDDPDFEEEYIEAISRPRTTEELEYELILARTTFKHWQR